MSGPPADWHTAALLDAAADRLERLVRDTPTLEHGDAVAIVMLVYRLREAALAHRQVAGA